MTSETNSEKNPFLRMLELWIESKQLSVDSEDNWKFYEGVLKDSLKLLSINYARGVKDWYLNKVGDLIKVAKKELLFIAEYRKKKEIPF